MREWSASNRSFSCLRLTTWNANSIRLRESALRRIVAELRPDVLCLQEIKVEDGLFRRSCAGSWGSRICTCTGRRPITGWR